MICLDTNVLVRYFLAQDDPETESATELIETQLTENETGFVTAVTLCEVIWVLRNRYNFARTAQVAVVRLMLEVTQFKIEHDDCARAGLESEHPDLADAVIHFVGAKHGCAKTVTFDKKFARLDGVELLTQ